MANLDHDVIQLGLQLRAQGQFVDRQVLSEHFSPEKAQQCFQIWQHHLEQLNMNQRALLPDSLSNKLSSTFQSILTEIEKQNTELTRQAELKLEQLHQNMATQTSQQFAKQTELTIEIKKLRAELKQKQSNLTENQKQLDQTFSQADQSRHLLDQKEEENRSLWRQLEGAKSEIETYKIQLSDALVGQQEASTTEKRLAQKKEENLTAEIETYKAETQNLQQQVAQYKQQIQLLQESQDKEKNNALESDHRLHSRLKESEAQLARHIAESANLEAELEAFQQNKHKEVSKLKSELSAAHIEIMDKNKNLESLTIQLAELKNKTEERQHIDKEKLETQADKLAEQNKELQFKDSTIAELESKNQQLTNEFRLQIDLKSREIDQLKQEHKHQKNDFAQQTEQLKRQITQLETAHEYKQRDSASLIESYKQEAKNKQELIKQTEIQISELKAELANLSNKLDNQIDTSKKLNDKLEQVKDKNLNDASIARQTIKVLREDLQKVQSEYDNFKQNSQQNLMEYKLKFEYAEKQLRQTEEN
ncbi:hypothetical protein [Catenovulum maritimum]|nr:hypothetical protein [Catenovulum maritimum]